MTVENALKELRHRIASDEVKYMLGLMPHNSAIKIAAQRRDFWKAMKCPHNFNHWGEVVKILECQAINAALIHNADRSATDTVHCDTNTISI